MAVIECSRCGGRLEINADMSVGTCMYCGSVITIPKSWEKKSNLYNRANYLRQSNEFDKAAEIFEDILKEDPKTSIREYTIEQLVAKGIIGHIDVV